MMPERMGGRDAAPPRGQLVERALAGDSELASRYDAVRRQLSETITSTRRSAYRRHEPSEAVRRS
jgi:hypothetical protein